MTVPQPPQGEAKTSSVHGTATFDVRHRLRRLAWSTIWFLLARWTPPPFHRWRLMLLRLFGARIHPTAKVYGSTRVWDPAKLMMGRYSTLGPGVNCYTMDAVTIATEVTVSQGVFLCTGSHDINSPLFDLVTRPIVLGDKVWIAAESFVGPGVTVGDGAVLAARGVAMRDMEPWAVYAGSPAVKLRNRSRF